MVLLTPFPKDTYGKMKPIVKLKSEGVSLEGVTTEEWIFYRSKPGENIGTTTKKKRSYRKRSNHYNFRK